MGKSVAIVSACIDFVDGQSLVTKEVRTILSENFFLRQFFYQRGFRPINFLKILILFLRSIGDLNLIYVVISRSFFGQLRDLPFLLICSLTKKKVVIHIHGNDFENLLYIKIASSFLTKNVSVICCTNSQLLFFDQLGYSCVLINNFILNNRLIEYKKLKRVENKVLFLSNLIYSKGPVHAILAVEMLQRYNCNYELKVVGNIPGYSKFRKLNKINEWRRLFERPYIEITGPIYDSNLIKELFYEYNIFCFPSFYKTEANPIALIEAACNGMKIVVFDREIFRELLIFYSAVVFVDSVLPSVLADGLLTASKMSVNFEEVELIRSRYSLKKFKKNILEVIDGHF